MSEFAKLGTSADCSAARCGATRDRILLIVLLYAMIRTGQALAGDQVSVDEKLKPDARAEPLPLPSSLFSTNRSFADGDAFSATEFRPREHAVTGAHSAAGAGFGSDAPMLQSTSVWQTMAEYRSQDRVRVLTLLETHGSTLSLQASKRGGPSLQWSSRRMNREGGTRGLLDRLVSAALRGAGNSQRASPNTIPSPSRPPTAAPAALKTSILSPAGAAQ